MPASEPCHAALCKEPAKVEGWCMKHRFGVCETPGCGKLGIGRLSLSKLENLATMSGPVLITRHIGSPIVCQDCHDKVVVKQKEQASAAADYLAEMTAEPKKAAKAA